MMADEARPARHNKPIFSSVSPDIKLLAITFAGTVAANLVTVILVGLAIAIAHTHIDSPQRADWPDFVILVVLTVISIVVPFVWFTMNRHRRYRADIPFLRLVAKVAMVCSFALIGSALVLILTWVGLASGIK